MTRLEEFEGIAQQGIMELGGNPPLEKILGILSFKNIHK